MGAGRCKVALPPSCSVQLKKRPGLRVQYRTFAISALGLGSAHLKFMLDLIGQSSISLWDGRTFGLKQVKFLSEGMHTYFIYQPGRCFLGRFQTGEDVIGALECLCAEIGIWMAHFSVTGSVSSATFGIYDQKQQVYVTEKQTRPFEILSCTGNVSAKGEKRFISAGMVLADSQAKPVGGRLFSPTLAFSAEYVLQELVGKRLDRSYDSLTGMQRWPEGKEDKEWKSQ